MKRILVVDDEKNHLRAINRVLMDLDHVMAFAQSGEEALERIHDFEPDLVLLDIIMPGMDGYEVCRRIRSSSKTSGIMILMLSAKATLDDRLKGYEVQADDYAVKPYHPAELAAKVQALLRIRNTQQEQERRALELQSTSAETKTSNRLLPICCSCKKVRDGKGYWDHVEKYIRDHLEADCSHSICPECAQELYPEFYREGKQTLDSELFPC